MWDLVENPEDRFSHNEAQLFWCQPLGILTDNLKVPCSYTKLISCHDIRQSHGTMESMSN